MQLVVDVVIVALCLLPLLLYLEIFAELFKDR